MKCQVSYSRKVSTGAYENMSIGHQIEYDCKSSVTSDQMFDRCFRFVEDKICQTLHELGVKPE
jgi:hypothetical protein